MIGELGALGGGLVPNAMGLSKEYLGNYSAGFLLIAVMAIVMLGVMRFMQIRWTRTWAEKGGRARTTAAHAPLSSAERTARRRATR
jgi:NNP family nitrate/nitrite transporter-like MFS transporter